MNRGLGAGNVSGALERTGSTLDAATTEARINSRALPPPTVPAICSSFNGGKIRNTAPRLAITAIRADSDEAPSWVRTLLLPRSTVAN